MSDETPRISVVVMEAEATAAAALQEAIGSDPRFHFGAAERDLPSLVNEVQRSRPDVIVLDLGASNGDVAAAMREVLARHPESCVIVTGADATPALVSRAVSAGARGFLLKPYRPQDLLQTIRDAYMNLCELRRLQRSERAPAPAKGSVIAVYSPKGGVGCTTIAANLAVALAAKGKRAVAIVDLDLQFGDVGCVLDLRSANSVTDLLDHADAIDATLVDEVFAKHRSGVRAVLVPENLAFLEPIDPERVVRALEGLRRHFDYIVCDLWSSLDDLTIATLRAADRVILVTTPELPALKNLRRAMSATAPLLLDDRTLIVANRLPGKAGVSVMDIERSLGRRVAARIPSEGVGITDAINQGISIFDPRARVRIGRSYRRLADLVIRELNQQPAPALQRAPSTA